MCYSFLSFNVETYSLFFSAMRLAVDHPKMTMTTAKNAMNPTAARGANGVMMVSNNITFSLGIEPPV